MGDTRTGEERDQASEDGAVGHAEPGNAPPPALDEPSTGDDRRRGRWERVTSSPRTPPLASGLVCMASLASRAAWIDHPKSLVFDENYYVPAARMILQHGVDPNAEHPPLAKVVIAGGIRLFGDNPLGWRSGSLLFGTVAMIGLYWLVRSVGGGGWLALGACSVMALENLFLVHGRIATLDVFVLAMMIVGAALYFSGHPVLGGVALGLGACMKLVGIYVLLVVVIYEVLAAALPRPAPDLGTTSPARRDYSRLGPLATVAASTIVSYLVILLLLDRAFTNFTNPIDHIRFMYAYGSHETSLLSTPGAQFAPASSAWQWLLNRVPIQYYRDYHLSGQSAAAVNFFQGRMSPAVIYATGPALVVAAIAAWRQRNRPAMLALAWFLGTFLPFLFISLQQRANYIYYMLVVLPGAYIAIALLFSRRYVPRVVTAAYGALLLYGLWALYPIRAWT